jgi:transposase InsO family protein
VDRDLASRAAPCRLVFFRAREEDGVSRVLEQRLERRYRQAGLKFDDCVTFVNALDRPRFFA